MPPEEQGPDDAQMQQLQQMGQEFGPAVAASLMFSPEVQETLMDIISHMLGAGPGQQAGNPMPLDGGMPPGGGMM